METIDDILREMRGIALDYLRFGNVSEKVFELLSSYADRLDAANKWMIDGLNSGIVERDEYIAKLTIENERLSKAPKERDEDVRELLKCLQMVYDEEGTDYGTGEAFDRIEAKMNGGEA